MLDSKSIAILGEALARLDDGFRHLPEFKPRRTNNDRLLEVLTATAERLQDNFPYFHPLYVGQMIKPPHPIARLAYALAMFVNPNNHALDGGRASSAMENEAVAQIARMFGWETHLGHLTGGGTMANFEALWIARELCSGRAPRVRRDPVGRFDRHRSAQARPATLRLRLRPLPRSGGWTSLQARFAVHILHIRRTAPR